MLNEKTGVEQEFDYQELAAMHDFGLDHVYNKWHNELIACGFSIDKRNTNLLRLKQISYCYHGHIVLSGALKNESFDLSAILSEQESTLSYYNSNITVGYLECGGSNTFERRDLGVLKVQAFMKKHADFLDDRGEIHPTTR